MLMVGEGQLAPEVVCAGCGDTIGVYEPVVVIGSAGVTRTSRAAGELPADGLVVHEACYRADTPASTA
jgi:hypothetical protein